MPVDTCNLRGYVRLLNALIAESVHPISRGHSSTATRAGPARENLMHPTMRNGILSLILLSSAILCGTHAAPIPAAETQPISRPNPPVQAQVMLAPGQVTATQVPQKEPMPADARNPDRILRVGHNGSVQALAFSPDGGWLASGGYDRVIIVWNLSSGREEFRLGGQKGTTTLPPQSLE